MNDNKDNGDFNPDKPQVPADVIRGVDWVTRTRERLAAEEAGVSQKTDKEKGDLPTPRTFEFALRNSQNEFVGRLEHTGFLIATGAFVGVANTEGIIQAIVPLDVLGFVQAVDKATAELNTLMVDDAPEPPQAA